MKKIILTGGGTAGHVTPNMALIPGLRNLGFEIHYIGTHDGIERTLIEREGVAYHPIHAGKLRRYFDFKNITDVFKIGLGFMEALGTIRKISPDVVFSKGGFVSCPVVWAAWINRIPVIIHESDITPGLANRLSMPFAKTICHAFPETRKYIPAKKALYTGIPVREGMYLGKADIGRRFCGFDGQKPVFMLIGGSLGSEVLNASLRAALERVKNTFDVCHIAGKNGIDRSFEGVSGYKQFEYVNEELPHVFAMADVVVSRAGATTLFEIAELKKPNLLIPLSRKASRGDQILNAESFKNQGFSRVLSEEELTPESFYENLMKVHEDREAYIKALSARPQKGATEAILKLISETAK